MKRITKIEASANSGEGRKLRTAAYCRVSTDSEDQLISLEAQKAHYEDLIRANPAWGYAGLYYDEGISGTKKDNRHGLQELLQACRDGKVDFIITKSISRFARNTTDCLEMVRSLKDRGISIYFEKENINTRKMEGELLLSVMSGFAAEESKSLSANVSWSVQKRFRDGTFTIGYPPFGYKNVDKKMVVNPDEAGTVREIFAAHLSGKGTHAIAKDLNERGVPSRKSGHWTATTIRSILTNEKYTGDVIFQKTFTDGSFNRHINHGEKNQFYARDHHEAIISREDFEQAAVLLKQRAREKGNGSDTKRYQNRYALSGKIVCGDCGGTFKRRKHYKPSGSYIAWACSNHINDKDMCGMKYVTDEGIKAAFVTLFRKLYFTRKEVLEPFTKALNGGKDRDKLVKLKELEEALEVNMEHKRVITSLMSSGYLEPGVFNQQMRELEEENASCQRKKDALSKSISTNIAGAEEAEKLLVFISTRPPLEAFDDETFLKYIDQVVIVSREEAEFRLKCGLHLRERLVE